MNKVHVPARVPERVIAEVREVAHELGMNFNRAVEVALINWVDEYKPNQVRKSNKNTPD